ncbi:MAG TPA: hypothetical protein VLF14_08285 [Candidatus Binatia bacterium]|nr:hypothetical protein [Candidatus Binatia bacterium]
MNAMRGPSYLRLTGSHRTGAIEIPDSADSAATGHFADREVSDRCDAILRLLNDWRAPVLSDDEIEIYAKVFLMKPGHEFVPFFLWLDDATKGSGRRG